MKTPSVRQTTFAAAGNSGETPETSPASFVVLPFDGRNRLWLGVEGEPGETRFGFVIQGGGEGGATPERAVAAVFGKPLPTRRIFTLRRNGAAALEVWFALLDADGEAKAAGNGSFHTVEALRKALAERPRDFAPEVADIIPGLGDRLVEASRLPYGEQEYIYRFRTEKQRNRSVYHLDDSSLALYQSRLCEAIKTLKRVNERSSAEPALLDFGTVRYVLPSHFGFCLGVQNAIERAYESLAENPGRRVFMLSELIHNPFVNEDLQARGLRCLQTDKGEPLRDPQTGETHWEALREGDIVVIPAFGATDADKRRLMEKGIAINRYDATCMLVEKVWKAARRFAESGHTVIIHGKAEHEETKATFSNAARHGPALIIRNLDEARLLGRIIAEENPDQKRALFAPLAGRHPPGFDPVRDLERVAVVNQTTLLRNETLGIIACLEEVFRQTRGGENPAGHLHPASKGDTLCYATQVNQDALRKSLALPLDAAVVAGGINSSNTFQLFRLCRERLGTRAFYIQSERNILSRERVRHYRFPEPGAPGRLPAPGEGGLEEVDFLPAAGEPLTILVTGGASCPDGIIQQIITRVNGLFPADGLRPVDGVLRALREREA